ncbi:unnamed protein product [Symbiodinium pilosum]|uniref:Uncharacterized protein n=1 Tax=Symbiodinium pilosum TaxID=2952 RepID=A0A812N301_SYMPI|nr:unnamed protein product [Symbiodinium pilosum]
MPLCAEQGSAFILMHPHCQLEVRAQHRTVHFLRLLLWYGCEEYQSLIGACSDVRCRPIPVRLPPLSPPSRAPPPSALLVPPPTVEAARMRPHIDSGGLAMQVASSSDLGNGGLAAPLRPALHPPFSRRSR